MKTVSEPERATERDRSRERAKQKQRESETEAERERRGLLVRGKDPRRHLRRAAQVKVTDSVLRRLAQQHLKAAMTPRRGRRSWWVQRSTFQISMYI